MRIIAGVHRRKMIVPPTNFKARPTTDFAKENLFNVIWNYFEFEDIDVLDLFSGTGGISYEFASRGAKKVVSIELNPIHHKFIAKTAKDLNLIQIQAVQTNAFIYLGQMRGISFDIIFADPPYQLEDIDKLPDLVFEADMLKQDGWFILEHSQDYKFENHPHFFEHRSYGSVNFSIFK